MERMELSKLYALMGGFTWERWLSLPVLRGVWDLR